MTGIVIPDGGTIGSTSDTDALTITSTGVVKASQSIATGTIKDATGVNNSISIATNGEATFAENIILTANKGLSFQNHSVSSATGASSTTSDNVLDDYEEGTWTPTISGATLDQNGTGFYIKVGNVVSIFAAFGNVTISNVSGYSYVTGFPFTTNFQSVGHTAHNTMSTVSQFYMGSGGTSALATADNSTGTSGAWQAGSGKYMFFQATYRTT